MIKAVNKLEQKIDDLVSETKSVTLSGLSEQKAHDLVEQLQLKLCTAEWEKGNRGTIDDSKAFTWSELNEDQQKKEYILHMKAQFPLPLGKKVVDGGKNTALLRVDLRRSGGPQLKGTTDAIIVGKHQQELGFRNNIDVLIELKKKSKMTLAHLSQAVGEQIAGAACSTTKRVFTILTDLDDSWHLFWFHAGTKTVYFVSATRAEALFLLKVGLAPPAPGSEDAEYSYPTHFLDRSAWEQKHLPDILERSASGDANGTGGSGGSDESDGDTNDEHHDHSSGDGRSNDNSSTQSPSGSVDSYDVLRAYAPSQDVACMLDLADMVDPEERYQMIREHVFNYVVPQLCVT